jgi:hypothetical protein
MGYLKGNIMEPGPWIDSVGLHAIAWHEAMIKFGHDVSFEQARSQDRQGEDKLIPVGDVP